MKKIIFVLLFAMTFSSAWAVMPDEILKDPVLEARARHISQQLRCLVCQGQTIDESEASLASDLRRLVRERLVAGDADADVLHFIQQRYGDYVLMQPPLTGRTYLLWFMPLVVFLAGAGSVAIYVRQSKKRSV